MRTSSPEPRAMVNVLPFVDCARFAIGKEPGVWRDRADISDSVDFACDLRSEG
jgi:hypothetical protein